MNHPAVKAKVAEWQNELRIMTNNKIVLLLAFESLEYSGSFDQLVNIICSVTGVPFEIVKHRDRHSRITLTRQLIIYYSYDLLKLTFKDIGNRLGGRDHTSIIHSRDRVKDLLESGDQLVCTWAEKINQRITELKEQN